MQGGMITVFLVTAFMLGVLAGHINATIKTIGKLNSTTECIEAIQACEADLPRSKVCVCEIKTIVTDANKSGLAD